MSESVKNLVSQMTNEQLFAVWFLIGAALVFWMQAGFAMVEAGFTRAKNTGNIIMKNLMDFCIGTVTFLLMGEDLVGLIGKPGFDIFTAYSDFNFSNFVFNLVFCATTATIVSGAMAERTKFLSYCVYSGIISAVIYPIEAHWIWGGGWLSNLGFHDFAGSCAIHMVGGISALIGAKILGARIGKFKKQKDGSVKVGAFPGHNIALGALGVFIATYIPLMLKFYRIFAQQIIIFRARIRMVPGNQVYQFLTRLWPTEISGSPQMAKNHIVITIIEKSYHIILVCDFGQVGKQVFHVFVRPKDVFVVMFCLETIIIPTLPRIRVIPQIEHHAAHRIIGRFFGDP